MSPRSCEKKVHFNPGFIFGCTEYSLDTNVWELDALTSVFEVETERICRVLFALAVLMLTRVSHILKSFTGLDVQSLHGDEM